MLLNGPRWEGRPGARRRARLRRFASAALLGAGLLVGGRAALAQVAPPAERVLVAARDLPAGAALTATDVRVVERPRLSGVRIATIDPETAVGRLLATPMRPGEEITSTRLVGADLLAGQPPGSRAVWLPASGVDALTGIGPGSHVDVHVSGSPMPVLRDVVVLARTGPTGSATALLGPRDGASAGLLVAAGAGDAGRVLGADLGEAGAFRFGITRG